MASWSLVHDAIYVAETPIAAFTELFSLLLGAEAPVMTPDGVEFSFLSSF